MSQSRHARKRALVLKLAEYSQAWEQAEREQDYALALKFADAVLSLQNELLSLRTQG